jgi:hypothetical protein
MQTLAHTGPSKLAAESVSWESDSPSSGGDSQWLSIRVLPLSRSDQLVAAQASVSMINEGTGRRTHTQPDCRS